MYKWRSIIGLKSLKIQIIVVSHEKANPVISNLWCQQVRRKYINFFTSKVCNVNSDFYIIANHLEVPVVNNA